MISGELKLSGFKAYIVPAHTAQNKDVQVLVFQDVHSQFQLHVIGTPEELQQLAVMIAGTKIIEATSVPDSAETQL